MNESQPAKQSPARAWFGDAFSQLHPQLQSLHSEGGVLAGPVQIEFGRALAGVLGRRIAKNLGIPIKRANNTLHVAIYHEDGLLHWNRRFNNRSEFKSTFRAIGNFPSGHWVETSDALSVELGVNIVNGGWHWQPRATRVGGARIPKWLAPRAVAFKEIRDELYHFEVAISLPLVGLVLAYRGDLMRRV